MLVLEHESPAERRGRRPERRRIDGPLSWRWRDVTRESAYGAVLALAWFLKREARTPNADRHLRPRHAASRSRGARPGPRGGPAERRETSGVRRPGEDGAHDRASVGPALRGVPDAHRRDPHAGMHGAP